MVIVIRFHDRHQSADHSTGRLISRMNYEIAAARSVTGSTEYAQMLKKQHKTAASSESSNQPSYGHWTCDALY